MECNSNSTRKKLYIIKKQQGRREADRCMSRSKGYLKIFGRGLFSAVDVLYDDDDERNNNF